jgi:hypothetical protein
MISMMKLNTADEMERVIDNLFKAKARYTLKDTFIKVKPFQCASRSVRESLKFLVRG